MKMLNSSVLDATTYADYKTFASNQTGNTILLAVSALGTTEVLIVLTAISLGTFLTCAGVFGHIGHFMGKLLFNNLISSFYESCQDSADSQDPAAAPGYC